VDAFRFEEELKRAASQTLSTSRRRSTNSLQEMTAQPPKRATAVRGGLPQPLDGMPG